MPRKYISTYTVGDAHGSDILGVAVSKTFTVTCSSDGKLKGWSNSASERDLLIDEDVDKVGLHHVSVYEDVIDGQRVTLFATVSFSGICYLYMYVHKQEEISKKIAIKALDWVPEGFDNERKSYWGCQLASGGAEDENILALTTVTGQTEIFGFTVTVGDETSVNFEHRGTPSANNKSFATCVDVDTVQKRLAVGHQDGSVYLYDLEYLRLLYSFESFGLQSSISSNSLSTVRCLRFSPDATLLAVARDSGPYGTVALYDVKYGESVGSLVIPTHSSTVGIGSYAHSKWCLSLSFNEDGSLIATGGLDNRIRIWDVETRETEAVITINKTDASDEELANSTDIDTATCCGLSFIAKNANLKEGENDGLVIVGFDRAIRWFREAGGI
ncbi:hypothetical protein BRETT_005280 [Brettanomyces bruxellensis]|uniref:Antiviral protein SKI8 n=1 Tax=Dekkera bruxellensis TaxID=5007 RepID=A0A871R3J2_DEKBR|nr:uncharacterized protein BRETT_005280 [Brettanomyces bruxellensis]QOU18218.1 hypothetical protein BRETT_005280 [Brettanomyces bruxellensis]